MGKGKPQIIGTTKLGQKFVLVLIVLPSIGGAHSPEQERGTPEGQLQRVHPTLPGRVVGCPKDLEWV